MRARIAPLRSQFVFPSVRLALLRAARRDPAAFRLLQFSVQRDHLHLVIEARDQRSLSSGLRSVAIRVARYVNDLLRRRGALWADRWHGRALKTPREVRTALVYVLANFRKHSRRPSPAGLDPFSSAEWFEGRAEWALSSGRAPPWAEWAAWRVGARRPTPVIATVAAPPENEANEASAQVVTTARTWLARVGWRRRGPIGIDESPSR